jgi:hypothetical protein
VVRAYREDANPAPLPLDDAVPQHFNEKIPFTPPLAPRVLYEVFIRDDNKALRWRSHLKENSNAFPWFKVRLPQSHRATGGNAVLSHLVPVMLIASLLMTSLLTVANAQMAPLKARSFRDRVVDKISLNDTTLIWGMMLSRRPTRILVNTSWMRTNCADFYEKEIAALLKATPPVTSLYW